MKKVNEVRCWIFQLGLLGYIEMANKIEKVTCHDDITLPIKAQTIDELHHLQKKRSSPTTPIGAAQTVFSTISEEDRQRQQLQSIR